MRLEYILRSLHRLQEGGRGAFGHRSIECVSGWRHADQDKHDQAHALLSVVAAVKERYTGAGENEESADRPWWRLLAFRRRVQGLAGSHDLLCTTHNKGI